MKLQPPLDPQSGSISGHAQPLDDFVFVLRSKPPVSVIELGAGSWLGPPMGMKTSVGKPSRKLKGP